MQLKSDINVMDFLHEIKNCESDVFFETPEGDCLVLSSALSQYIFCSIIEQPEFKENGVIRFKSPADKKLLINFLCE